MPATALLFPGQGAQAVGMGRDLAARLPAARARFDEASEILGYDLLTLCADGPVDRLNATDVSQPAIFVSSLAALEALRADDPTVEAEVVAVAGLSLGEYTALAFAGVFHFAEGVRLVRARGAAMQAAAERHPGAMLSIIALDLPIIDEIVAEAKSAGLIEVANYLCPGNTVVSGSLEGCAAAERLVEAKGGKAVRLSVAGAFHTALMRPADEALAEALAAVELHTPRVPVWSNVDAQPHTDTVEIRRLLIEQVLRPVRWEESLRGLLVAGVERFYEVGPGRVLAGLLKRVNRKAECRNVSA